MRNSLPHCRGIRDHLCQTSPADQAELVARVCLVQPDGAGEFGWIEWIRCVQIPGSPVFHHCYHLLSRAIRRFDMCELCKLLA